LTRSSRYAAEKYDLARMKLLLSRLGDPQNSFQSIHIAGTKGKGSVSALIANSLQVAGNKVGLYSSPHLQDYTERIRVNGANIPKRDFISLLNEIKPHIEYVPKISTFELATALGFMFFSKMKVDFAVIEVGLGGRLDATNVISPVLSVITSISYDHIEVLGDTLAKIAFEKAGIIKQGCPIVLAPQKEEARRVVERVAQDRHAQLTLVGKDYLYAPWSHSLSNQSFLVWSAAEQEMVDEFIESGGRNSWEPSRLKIPLLGYHQVENSATAFAALHELQKYGVHLNEEDIIRGFAEVCWPGRFEVLRRTPPFIIDSAHNQDSALKLRLAIDDYLPGQPVLLIFGASEDKDIHGMLSALLPRVQRVIATKSLHPRGLDPNKVVEICHQFGCSAQAIVPIEDAISEALRLAGQESAIVVAGSLFVAAAAREIWFRTQQTTHTFGALNH
ncbi:MAG: bifunctional folylpolyglutamate synthase/dihydrofolate synthase, partial [Anaerolineaceae bacterium]|nr:bifunctional folylpolyglutamate synthase/dihydrofolate synthase [Anaerolineaceae bacterium]